MALPHSPTTSAAYRHALSRRGFLSGIGAVSLSSLLVGSGRVSDPTVREITVTGQLFGLGVASGDPLPDSVVLWTRLAPDPLAPDGRAGMPAAPVAVDWQLAEDPAFVRVVRQGTAVATAELGHSVHPEVSGLRPGREYFYRFRAAGQLSPVGRTRTAPSLRARVTRARLGVASCAVWHGGWYTAYRHLAAEDVDLVVHLGDYLYETPVPARPGRQVRVPEQFRTECTSLAHYRARYGLYKADPDLQAAHAAHPWAMTMDDHEVDNNWADTLAGTPEENPGFIQRRAAAFQAFYENLPLRTPAVPQGSRIRLYRALAWGDLMQLSLLDTRQYRTDQVPVRKVGPAHPSRLADHRTMMGRAQEQWLMRRFEDSPARWQVLANQTPMAQLRGSPATDHLAVDSWDGFAANRRRLLDGAVQRGVDDLVVLSGDRHRAHAIDLAATPREDARPVASEYVCTSITSGDDGTDLDLAGRLVLAANPHVAFVNSRRGYTVATLTPQLWHTEFKVVPFVQRRGAPVLTRAGYVTEAGRPGVQLDSAGPAV